MEDRHGRTARSDNDPRRRPSDGFRARDQRRFWALVQDAIAGLDDGGRAALRGARLVIEDVPVTVGEGETPAVQWDPDTTRLVIHRRVCEQRADHRADLVALLRAEISAVLEP